MQATIDKAGRVVIPAEIRKRLRLEPGTALDVVVDEFSVRLARSAPEPALERRGTRTVVRPRASGDLPEIDVAALIEEERDRWLR